MEWPSETIDMATYARRISVDDRISLRSYFRIADNILKQANIFRAEKNVIDLYIMLLCFSSLAPETIPSHRDYKTSLKSNKEYLRKRLLDVLTELEKLKPVVQKRIDSPLTNQSVMSNVTEDSSETSIVRYSGGIIAGFPKKCWCGASIIGKILKSKNNPYRRYYRCVFATSQKLVDDNHIFKWVDEVIVNEVEKLSNSAEGLEKSMMEVKDNRLKKVEIELQRLKMNEVLEKVSVVFGEFEWRMKKRMIIALILSMISIGIMKLSG